MAIDKSAQAYAKFHYPIFLSRYVGAVQAGRRDLVPEPIRKLMVAYAYGEPTDLDFIESWIKTALYNHRVQTGMDAPVPQEFPSVGRAAARGAVTGAKVGLGIASTLLRFLR